MKSCLIYPVIFLFFTFSACKKEPDPVSLGNDTPQPVFALSANAGSYYIYEFVEIDSNGNETQLTFRDSVFIAGDSLINGNTYIHYSGTWMGVQKELFIRDSSGFIVNHYGNIRFNHIGFTDTVSTYTNATQSIYIMTSGFFPVISVPAGDYTCYDHQLHYYNNNGDPFTACDSFWVNHTYYDYLNGVEIITQYAYTNPLIYQCKYMERRLVEAHWQ